MNRRLREADVSWFTRCVILAAFASATARRTQDIEVGDPAPGGRDIALDTAIP
ncbi:hypothetical protein [Rhodococcus tibetensis]|uniref:Uncharacterized protein n=1 Tax=Rhodococcus tibetensis TaxID=2965064 RepID=A0ABT1QCJ8_9NOCA|nr:hypothetical protein [Rhodococcus sp. FXJ9.536]MCQ4119999.1 hypothetical protein [Rhodococcus sp. FXJ9.536]